MIGDAGVLLEALFDLLGADVQVAERVGGVPIARLVFNNPHVLGDRGVDLTEFQGFIRRL